MKQEPNELSRRAFFKTVTVGSLVTVAATTAGVTQAKETSVHIKKSTSGYRQTEHINSYYNSLRS